MMVAAGDTMECTSDDCDGAITRDGEAEASFVLTEEQADTEVIESSAETAFEGKPTTAARCEKCGNDEAWYEIRQTASADEPPTRFYKCTECGARWRGYG